MGKGSMSEQPPAVELVVDVTADVTGKGKRKAAYEKGPKLRTAKATHALPPPKTEPDGRPTFIPVAGRICAHCGTSVSGVALPCVELRPPPRAAVFPPQAPTRLGPRNCTDHDDALFGNCGRPRRCGATGRWAPKRCATLAVCATGGDSPRGGEARARRLSVRVRRCLRGVS
jgi:hypothetical protein